MAFDQRVRLLRPGVDVFVESVDWGDGGDFKRVQEWISEAWHSVQISICLYRGCEQNISLLAVCGDLEEGGSRVNMCVRLVKWVHSGLYESPDYKSLREFESRRIYLVPL